MSTVRVGSLASAWHHGRYTRVADTSGNSGENTMTMTIAPTMALVDYKKAGVACVVYG